jgi:hypothetical protein
MPVAIRKNFCGKTVETFQKIISITLQTFFLIPGCLQRSGDEGSAGVKVFLALGICLAAVFLIFYIVVKGREKD